MLVVLLPSLADGAKGPALYKAPELSAGFEIVVLAQRNDVLLPTECRWRRADGAPRGRLPMLVAIIAIIATVAIARMAVSLTGRGAVGV